MVLGLVSVVLGPRSLARPRAEEWKELRMAAELLAPPSSDRRWEAALWVRPKGYRRALTKDHCLMAMQWVKALGSHSVLSKELQVLAPG